jgi:hypothetical protein
MRMAMSNLRQGLTQQTRKRCSEAQTENTPLLASEQLSAAAHPWPNRLLIFVGIYYGLQFALLDFIVAESGADLGTNRRL